MKKRIKRRNKSEREEKPKIEILKETRNRVQESNRNYNDINLKNVQKSI